MGGQYEWNSGKLVADSRRVRFPVPLTETAVYPGFPTDLQSPLMAVFATIPGESRIQESVFEDRFKIAEELNRMGAEIKIQGRKHGSAEVFALKAPRYVHRNSEGSGTCNCGTCGKG